MMPSGVLASVIQLKGKVRISQILNRPVKKKGKLKKNIQQG